MLEGFCAQRTWGGVVAHSEEWRDTTASASKTTSTAVLHCATDAGSALPDNLRIVAPILEVAHVWFYTVGQRVPANLVIVHLVGNHGWDVLRRGTGTNVLAIPAATLLAEEMSVQAATWQGRSYLRIVGIDT